MDLFRYKDSSGANISSPWPLNQTEANREKPDVEAQKMREMLNDLTEAVLNFGPSRQQHMKTLVRHRTEWPFLWEKIDTIVSFIASDAGREKDE